MNRGRLTVLGYGHHDGHWTIEALQALRSATKLFYLGHPSPMFGVSQAKAEWVYDYSIGRGRGQQPGEADGEKVDKRTCDHFDAPCVGAPG